MNVHSLAALICAVISFVLGFFVWSKEKKNPIYIIYFLLNFSVTFWAFNTFVLWSATDVNVSHFFKGFHYIFAVFMPVLFLNFVSLVLKEKKSERRYLKYLYGFSVGLAALTQSKYFIEGFHSIKPFFNYIPNPGIMYTLFVLYYYILLVCAYCKLIAKYRSSSGAFLQQLKYLLVGSLFGFSGMSVFYLLVYGINLEQFIPHDVLIIVYNVIFAYAIVAHQLMDITVIIKKTLIFAGLFTAAYGIFSGFVFLSSTFFEVFAQNRMLVLMLTISIIVLILRPLENVLINVTDKFLFQKKYDYRKLLRTFADEVLSVLKLEKLTRITVNKLVEILKLENASIALYNADNEEFRISASVGIKKPMFRVKEDHPLVLDIQKGDKYFLLQDPSRKKVLKLEILEKITELNAELVVPLMHGVNMLGLLFLGKKKSDEDFVPDDIDILLPLARTLSIAISNAQLFEKLSVAQAQAAQREKMAVIGTLSSGINHEICNPLGIARGQCEMFLLNYADGVYSDRPADEVLEKAQEIMRKVLRETDRATTITRKLSAFAKPAKGELEDDIQVEKELEEVVILVEHELNVDNVEIKKEINKNLPRISADRKQIQEIFFNIVRNAAQSIKGNGEITMRAWAEDRKVHVEIEDTGSGISKAHLDQIFNPFFTTKDPGKGTGLGLFIVKQVVERNNGTINVKSELGKGTIFYLAFNAVESEVKVRG